MTFFDVNAAETAAHNAIQGLEAKGWQAEIVDPEDMGASRLRGAGACDARADGWCGPQWTTTKSMTKRAKRKARSDRASQHEHDRTRAGAICNTR